MGPGKPPNRLPAHRGQEPGQQSTVVSRQQLTFHQGPLPPPEQLAQYNLIVPGAAERIISLAERQAEHRKRLAEVLGVEAMQLDEELRAGRA